MGANPRKEPCKNQSTLKGSNDLGPPFVSTYTQIYYHIVFSTKERVPALLPENRENLFRYTWGILKMNPPFLSSNP